MSSPLRSIFSRVRPKGGPRWARSKRYGDRGSYRCLPSACPVEAGVARVTVVAVGGGRADGLETWQKVAAAFAKLTLWRRNARGPWAGTGGDRRELTSTLLDDVRQARTAPQRLWDGSPRRWS